MNAKKMSMVATPSWWQFKNWFAMPFKNKIGTRRSLVLESLEDRFAPAALMVNSTLDTVAADANLTLREAIAIVNAGNTAGRSAQEIAQISGTP